MKWRAGFGPRALSLTPLVYIVSVYQSVVVSINLCVFPPTEQL